jgi:hypothetical protein
MSGIEEKICDDCGEPTTDYEILIDTVRCRECWDKYIQNGYISRLETTVEMLEETRAELIRERDEYLELISDALCQFGHHVKDENGNWDGWIDDNGLSTLEDIADALVKVGLYEQHKTYKRLYRRTK